MSRWLARLYWFFLCLSVGFGGCSDSGTKPGGLGPDQEMPGENKPFLASCTNSLNCASGRCIEVGAKKAICTRACDADNDCPSSQNWTCGTPREVNEQLCLCLADGPERCGDGIDNDCDGKTDDCLSCGGRLIPPDSRQHCGACGVYCPVGTACQNGQCQCPDGRPASECSAQDTPQCVGNEDCDDKNLCTFDRCTLGRCEFLFTDNACGPTENCDLRLGACQPAKACAVDRDCADNDPCTAEERCDPALRVCRTRPFDGDNDGDPAAVCGGTDCNDGDARIYGFAPEFCDGIDNNCDGDVDLRLTEGACADNRSCVEGGCACNEGLLACGNLWLCYDTQSDADHCGVCGNSCVYGQSCTAGQCVCPEGTTFCSGLCRPPEWFTFQDDNCGGCGQACSGLGEVCVEGQCECTNARTLCGGACTDTQWNRENCGGCGEVCGPTFAGCEAGACYCPYTTDRVCGGVCVSATDPLNCGECNNECALCGTDTCEGAARLFVGGNASCALMTNAEVYCWGTLSTTVNQPRRINIASNTALSGVADVVMGESYACARTSAGLAYCWGSGAYGVLGDGTTTSSVLARLVSTSAGVALSGIAELSTTRYLSTCARLTSGEAYCWGSGTAALGNGSTVAQSRPVRVETAAGTPLTDIAAIFVGARHSCARVTNGQLYCWGSNGYGQLGDGTITTTQRPVRVETSAGTPLAGVVDVVMGWYHTCARLSTNELWCWGANGNGQLGIGTTVGAPRPARIELSSGVPLTNVAEIFASSNTTCARRTNGEAYCWGDAVYGILGADFSESMSQSPLLVGKNGSPPYRATSGPVMGPDGSQRLACAEQDGAEPQLTCWGYNVGGQLGKGDQTSSSSPSIVRLPSGVQVAEYGIGYGHVCARLESGLVYCWGSGAAGQLGTPLARAANLPTLVLWPSL